MLTFAGSLLAIIWIHAKKNELIYSTFSPSAIQNVILQTTLASIVFSISTLISLVNVQIAYYFWLVMTPTKIIINKKYPY